MHFERGELVVDDNVGQILFKKTVGVPRSYSAWQRRYYVLGGAVAKSHVLQVYVSKQVRRRRTKTHLGGVGLGGRQFVRDMLLPVRLGKRIH